jgi:transposase
VEEIGTICEAKSPYSQGRSFFMTTTSTIKNASRESNFVGIDIAKDELTGMRTMETNRRQQANPKTIGKSIEKILDALNKQIAGKEFFDRFIDNGKKYKVAIVAAMRKLITTLNAMIKTNTLHGTNIVFGHNIFNFFLTKFGLSQKFT